MQLLTGIASDTVHGDAQCRHRNEDAALKPANVPTQASSMWLSGVLLLNTHQTHKMCITVATVLPVQEGALQQGWPAALSAAQQHCALQAAQWPTELPFQAQELLQHPESLQQACLMLPYQVLLVSPPAFLKVDT